jgi:hypothetical protein
MLAAGSLVQTSILVREIALDVTEEGADRFEGSAVYSL